MAWEQRGGGRYYYKKRRLGQRVISEYLGQGQRALAQAEMVLQARHDRVSRRQQFQQFIHEQKAIDQALKAPRQILQIAIEAGLRAAGFHCHRGVWRRRRQTGFQADATSR